MRNITLSDHAADQAEAAASARAANYEAEKAKYAHEVDQHNTKSAELRQKSQAAFRERRWLAWLVSFLPRMGHAMKSAPPPPTMAAAGRDEIVWNAGNDGEKRVADILSTRFSDDWTMISGYRNQGGEIDKLLVGPEGIIAIEIKFINGRIFCNGDRWWRDKYDRYGNLVESNLTIADKKGRGPSMQVNASTDRLQAFLNQRMPAPRIARAVIFSHDSSEIGGIDNPTVDLIAKAESLSPDTVRKCLPHTPIDPAQAIEWIRKDHAFHARPRAKNHPPKTGRRQS